MRAFAVIVLSFFGISQTLAQSGSLRPAYCPPGLVTTADAHLYLQPAYSIRLTSMNPSFSSAQWSLVPAEPYVKIVLAYSAGGQRAMTANGNINSAVTASKIDNSDSQLWTASNPIGILWQFVSKSTGLALGSLGGGCAAQTPMALVAQDGGTNWVWNQ